MEQAEESWKDFEETTAELTLSRKPTVSPDREQAPPVPPEEAEAYSSNRKDRRKSRDFTKMIEKLTFALEAKDAKLEEMQRKWDARVEEGLLQVKNEKRIESLEKDNQGLKAEIAELEHRLLEKEKELTSFRIDSLEREWGAPTEPEAPVEIATLQQDLRDTRYERDNALHRAGELAQQLAESRANADDILEQLHQARETIAQMKAAASEQPAMVSPQPFWKRTSWSRPEGSSISETEENGEAHGSPTAVADTDGAGSSLSSVSLGLFRGRSK